MPFDHLLTHSLIPGATSAKEQGVGFSFNRDSDESVLVFRLDESATRKILKLEQKPCCDYLVFFNKLSFRPLLVFVELKSTNLDRAGKQILSAANAIRRQAPNLKETQFRGVIVSSSTPPRDFDKLQKHLRFQHIQLYFGSIRGGKSIDLRTVLTDDFAHRAGKSR